MISKKYFLLLTLGWHLIFRTCSDQSSQLEMSFEDFRVKYEKPHLEPEEYLRRELIFYQNIKGLRKMIEEGCQSCGVTQFYDETRDEFRARMGLMMEDEKNGQFDNNSHAQVVKSTDSTPFLLLQNAANQGENNESKRLRVSSNESPVPDSLNWNEEGKVTSVKNQGTCGTCWSFATAAAIESSMILKGQFINFFLYEPDLSEQFMLTCARYGDCRGGYLQEVIDLAYSKGVPFESQVPYEEAVGNKAICSSDDINKIFFTTEEKGRYSYYDISDEKIIELLQSGPLAISISADNWENYGSGTFACATDADINHAVLLVGYDPDRWIVKNQWGDRWGENGYIYVTRNQSHNCRVGSSVHQLWESNLKAHILMTTALIALAVIF